MIKPFIWTITSADLDRRWCEPRRVPVEERFPALECFNDEITAWTAWLSLNRPTVSWWAFLNPSPFYPFAYDWEYVWVPAVSLSTRSS